MRKLETKICENCENEFSFMAGSKAEVRNRRFCSHKCKGAYWKPYYKKARLGKGNPMFGKKPWNFTGEFWAKSGSRQKYKKIWVGNKCYWEHRWVMEQKLGRKLKQSEIVHHIDHNPNNNSPSNLIIMNPFEHSSYHGKLQGHKSNGQFTRQNRAS